MSKKHFIQLADALRPAYKSGNLNAIAIESILDFCKRQNSQFKQDRWLGYLREECGPNGGSR